jgi:RNA polymerase sigma-70 factor (ECF subfamily)
LISIIWLELFFYRATKGRKLCKITAFSQAFLSPREGNMTSSEGSVTQLLIDWRNGDETALDKLIPIVHEELRKLAHYYMRHERPGHILQTSALINEAYMRLVDHKGMRWQNRAHFYAVAAQAMRRVLIDEARKRDYIKRGGDINFIPLDEAADLAQKTATDLISLDDALTALAAFDWRKSQVVEMRYFGGMTTEEIAEVLEIGPATVARDWDTAKAWLKREISSERSIENPPAEA